MPYNSEFILIHCNTNMEKNTKTHQVTLVSKLIVELAGGAALASRCKLTFSHRLSAYPSTLRVNSSRMQQDIDKTDIWRQNCSNYPSHWFESEDNRLAVGETASSEASQSCHKRSPFACLSHVSAPCGLKTHLRAMICIWPWSTMSSYSESTYPCGKLCNHSSTA